MKKVCTGFSSFARAFEVSPSACYPSCIIQEEEENQRLRRAVETSRTRVHELETQLAVQGSTIEKLLASEAALKRSVQEGQTAGEWCFSCV